MSHLRLALAALAALVVAAVAIVAWAPVPAVDEPDATASPAPDASQAARGAQLALAGNCAGCHTERGGAPYAGGRGIETPFGTVVAGNLTPDPATGLGRWTAAEFRRALQHGVSRDGRLLVPAFPYTSFTQVTRDDADALWAHLRSLPPVQLANRPHALRWPYGSPLALRVWRALYFRPGTTPAAPSQSAEWNRGAYLVRGLGHCEACHARRDALGGIRGAAALQGGRLPQGWYAPSLTDAAEAGVADWPLDEVVRLLRTGLSERGTAQGPMAEVVVRSTQHLPEADLRAVAVYLRSLPSTTSRPGRSGTRDPQVMARGQALYADLCRGCHGDEGQGAPGVYPALAGSRMVAMADTTNLLRVITQGGFAPATAANPRPYGMPPFDLGHADLAALMTWLRAAWGHDASPVSEVQVLTAR